MAAKKAKKLGEQEQMRIHLIQMVQMLLDMMMTQLKETQGSKASNSDADEEEEL
jgi:hypothetical protein